MQESLFDDEPVPATGPPVVAATDGSAREADVRAGAVVAALHAGEPPASGPGWTG
jgi:hypothetical protein